ncbi:hypothetical protein AB0T83_01375 [Fluviibacterium sp. DFM31]|uniref:Uncharacterized protein n=1 Tax=Meridianimarinicoccus marinus TaxID=3231483 RepID=A0ABV3L4X3_9RHOB
MKRVIASAVWLCSAAGAGQAASLSLLNDVPEISLTLPEASTGAATGSAPVRLPDNGYLDLSKAPHPVARPDWLGQAMKTEAFGPSILRN